MTTSKKIVLAALFLSISVGAVILFGFGGWSYIRPRVYKKTTASVLENVGENARAFWRGRSSSDYPPKRVTLLALKDQKVLEVWSDSPRHLLATIPVLAASGKKGPKLREGDRQVPEGIYDITALNPNSSYHLSMHVDYPNRDDLKWAKSEGRTSPGSDIFIHGERVSIGCLALGNRAIERLFVLVADVGTENTRVVIAPTDPRIHELVPGASDPPWVAERYQRITEAFALYR